jgi:hypothetical protein
MMAGSATGDASITPLVAASISDTVRSFLKKAGVAAVNLSNMLMVICF